MVLNIKGVALQSSNQRCVGRTLFMSAIKKSPASDYTFCNLGNLNFKKGEFDLAKQNYQEALRLNPNNQQAANNLGTVFKELGELKKAEKFYLMAINIDKNFAEPLQLRSYSETNKQNRKAEIAYKNALTIRPPISRSSE